MLPPVYGSVTRLNVAANFVFLIIISISCIRCTRLLHRLENTKPHNPGVNHARLAVLLSFFELLIVFFGTILIVGN